MISEKLYGSRLIFFLVSMMSSFASGFVEYNEIIGTPRIQCDNDVISISFRTRTAFKGSIYVSKHYGVEQCRQEFFTNEQPGATFAIRIGECGMMRSRQLQPLGLNYMVTFGVLFNTQFITKNARSYNVRCFYAQTDKIVRTNLEVAHLPSENLEQETLIVPQCEYTVREGTVDGPQVYRAVVGQTVVHRWHCDNPNYGMLVKSCIINDGSGLSKRILDERGCAVSYELLNNQIEYEPTLNMAYVVLEAFGFPDRDSQAFECQIELCNKRDNACVGVSPPNCPNVPRAEYLPNSIVDPSVNPTKVVATFDGTVFSSLGNTVIDGNVRPIGLMDNRLPNVLPHPRDFRPYPWRKEQDALHEGEGDEHENPSEGPATQPITTMGNDEDLLDTPTEDPHSTTYASISIDEWTRPTLSSSFQRDDPIEIFVVSTSPAPNDSIIKPVTSERGKRNPTISVSTGILGIDNPMDAAPRRPSIFASERIISPESMTCLNQTAVVAMAAAFGLTTILSIAFIIYLVKELNKGCQSDGLERFASASVCSTASVDSMDQPVYTRRLGTPVYVVPSRNYHA